MVLGGKRIRKAAGRDGRMAAGNRDPAGLPTLTGST